MLGVVFMVFGFIAMSIGASHHIFRKRNEKDEALGRKYFMTSTMNALQNGALVVVIGIILFNAPRFLKIKV